jgi:hypothetical protein
MKWKSIDSAPKDGTWLLLGGGSFFDEKDGAGVRKPAVARWVSIGPEYDYYGWLIAEREGGYNNVTYEHPTHWMPIPSPPGGSE